MGPVGRLVRRHGGKDSQEFRLFVLEAFRVVLASIHRSPLSGYAGIRADGRRRLDSSHILPDLRLPPKSAPDISWPRSTRFKKESDEKSEASLAGSCGSSRGR